MDIKEKVGARIRELRTEKKWSQEDLGLEADVDRTYVTDTEAGRRNISMLVLERFTNALKISLSDFFKSPIFKQKAGK